METQILVAASDAADRARFAGLGSENVHIVHSTSFADTVRKVLAGAPDAVLLVIDHATDAGEQCEVLRALGDFPIIVLAEALPPALAAQCLDRGADAALPLNTVGQTLAPRIHAVLRRTTARALPTTRAPLTIGHLSIDLDAREVTSAGARVDLSPTEFQVLAALAETPGRVVTNRDLLVRVWGEEYADELHYVRLYVGYLRAKLERNPRRPQIIVNQWGVGYRLAIESASAAETSLLPR